jgi:hypothetical protein
MTAIEALTKLRSLKDGDPERAHIDADDILLAFLRDHDPACAEIAEAYAAVDERIGFWYA